MASTKIEIVLDSPHGKRPIEDFKAHLQDLKSEGLERFGLEIRFQELDVNPEVSEEEFK